MRISFGGTHFRATSTMKDASKTTSPILSYFFALLLVASALALRFLLLPWTGTGAPFVFFFAAVLVSSFVWGIKPGLWAGIVSTLIAAFLFVYQAKHTVSQAVAQSSVFLIEISIISVFAARFAKSKRQVAQSLAAVEKTARERQIFFALIENSSDFIGIADPEGTPIYVNPAGRRMVGLAADFPVGSTQIPEYYPMDRRTFAKDVIVKSMIELGHWEGETFFRNWQTQKAIPVSDTHFMIREPATGQILGMGTVTRDISELKRVQSALERRERELMEAQRVAHVGSWSFDSRNDTVEWSEELYHIFGRDLDLPPPKFSEHPLIYTHESMSSLKRAVEAVLREGTPYELDLELIRPDGTTRWISARGEAVRDASGAILGVRGTKQDITLLKQLQKMREEWTSVIAHDLRQPIGVIDMSANLLAKRCLDLAVQERGLIERIRLAATSLARMVDDLLDVSLLEAHRLSIERKWLDPRTIVQEAVERMAGSTAGLQLTISEKGELAPVFVDRLRIEQVLGNLITNATKYGDKKSDIHVEMAQHESEIELSVTNRGPGIPSDELPRLFSRFSRSKATRDSGAPGLGLGLYISKGLVEAHGGRIWAESTPGQETTFHFTLPSKVASRRRIA